MGKSNLLKFSVIGKKESEIGVGELRGDERVPILGTYVPADGGMETETK